MSRSPSLDRHLQSMYLNDQGSRRVSSQSEDEESLLDPADYISPPPTENNSEFNGRTSKAMNGRRNNFSTFSQFANGAFESPFRLSSDGNTEKTNSLEASLRLSRSETPTPQNMGASTIIPPYLESVGRFGNSYSSIEETPLQFLIKKEKYLMDELHNNISIHGESLNEGKGSVRKLRSMVQQNFDHLREVHLSFIEIYQREKDYRLELSSNFKEWENKRKKIIATIKSIRSTDNDVGMKLNNLVLKSNDISREISILEERLASLRQSKKAVTSEIYETTSIMESRSSSYLGAFESLESQAESAIKRLSNMDGYVIEMPVVSGITKIEEEFCADSILALTETIDAKKESLPNLADPPTRDFKSTFSQLIGTIMPASETDVPRNDFGLSDIRKKRSRIDIGPVLESLTLQTEAFEEEIQKQVSQMRSYEESSIIWRDVQESISDMEERLLKGTIRGSYNSGKSESEVYLVDVLNLAFSNLESRMQVAKQSRLIYVEEAILNEMRSVSAGLRMITGRESERIKNVLLSSDTADTEDHNHLPPQTMEDITFRANDHITYLTNTPFRNPSINMSSPPEISTAVATPVPTTFRMSEKNNKNIVKLFSNSTGKSMKKD